MSLKNGTSRCCGRYSPSSTFHIVKTPGAINLSARPSYATAESSIFLYSEFGGTVTLKRLNAMFRIEMSEENTGEVRYVEGRWHGTFYHSIATETVVSDLK